MPERPAPPAPAKSSPRRRTTATTKRSRRTPQEIIADLEAQVARIQARGERRKAKKDPALRHISAAVRSIDKALSVSEDVVTRQGLDEARATLGAVLSLNGAAPKAGRGGTTVRMRRGGKARADEVLQYVASHPGSRCEEVAAAVGAETRAVGAVLKTLKAEGKARSVGKARGMKYFAKAAR